MNQPVAVVLGGINGAGKTTAARSLLAEELKLTNFVNADTLATGLCGFAPEVAAVAAGRAMLQRLRELADDHADFAWETTLSGKTYLSFLHQLKTVGYRIDMYYFWLPTIELEIERIALRVSRGGHDIPVDTLRRWFGRSFHNFWFHYRLLADGWVVYDNSMHHPKMTAAGSGQRIESIIDTCDWNLFQELVGHG